MRKIKEFTTFLFYLPFSFLIAGLTIVQRGAKKVRVKKSKLIYKSKYCWRMFVRGKASAEELIDPVE